MQIPLKPPGTPLSAPPHDGADDDSEKAADAVAAVKAKINNLEGHLGRAKPAAATPTSISSAGTTMASSHRSLGSFCSALMSSTSDSYTSRWLHDVERGGREHGRHPAAAEQGGTRLLRQRIEVYQLGQRITSLQSLGILTQQ